MLVFKRYFLTADIFIVDNLRFKLSGNVNILKPKVYNTEDSKARQKNP